jgi:hypothetical protein
VTALVDYLRQDRADWAPNEGQSIKDQINRLAVASDTPSLKDQLNALQVPGSVGEHPNDLVDREHDATEAVDTGVGLVAGEGVERVSGLDECVRQMSVTCRCGAEIRVHVFPVASDVADRVGAAGLGSVPRPAAVYRKAQQSP